MEAAARPLPSEDTTPPVTKMYFGATSSLPFLGLQPCTNIVHFRRPVDEAAVQPRVAQRRQRRSHGRTPRRAERDHVVAAERRRHVPPVGQPPRRALAGEAA